MHFYAFECMYVYTRYLLELLPSLVCCSCCYPPAAVGLSVPDVPATTVGLLFLMFQLLPSCRLFLMFLLLPSCCLFPSVPDATLLPSVLDVPAATLLLLLSVPDVPAATLLLLPSVPDATLLPSVPDVPAATLLPPLVCS